MRVKAVDTAELDERLDLDKRCNTSAFCVTFHSLDEAPDGFYDLQSTIRDGLERRFAENFGNDGVDRSDLKAWELPRYRWFCFNTDMCGAECIETEIVDEILGDKLVGIVLAYLEKEAPRYCMVAEVYRTELKGKNYIGRFVINLHEIAVEETLADIWSRNIQIMPLEEA